VAFTPVGIVMAMSFVGFPFVVRSVQPVLEDLDPAMEEAAASLGANVWQRFTRVIAPVAFPALLTGTALAFARAAGEYGSVIFIAGNMPMKTEITTLLIVTKLEEYDYSGAAAIAGGDAWLCPSSIMLLVNLLQWWGQRREGKSHMSGRRAILILLAAPPIACSSSVGRVTLILLRSCFSLRFLILPVAAVFTQALSQGWKMYRDSICQEDVLSALAPHRAGRLHRGSAQSCVWHRRKLGDYSLRVSWQEPVDYAD
jgi:ABC-type sulfate transport system permease component